MARGPLRPDPNAPAAQRSFDQRVADILNALVLGGVLVQTSGGWTISLPGEASGVLMLRTFNFSPPYTIWGG